MRPSAMVDEGRVTVTSWPRLGSANSRTSTDVDEVHPFLERDVANDALGVHPFGAGVGGALEEDGVGLPEFVAFAVAWQFLNI